MNTPIYDFTDTVALVTGATGGMGHAITLAFAGAGATVIATDLAADAGNALVDASNGARGTVEFHRANVADDEQVAALIGATVSQHGRLDVAVNAAAIEFETVPLADCTVDDLDRMLDVNVGGVFSCMKHELRAMLDNGGLEDRERGSIVNIASTNSFRPQHDQPAYTASKHAVLGLTRSAAMDYARHGIRVNAICPGAIDTPMLRSAVARRGRDADEVAGRLSNLGRFGQPDEIAAAALWLCSPGASFTTGHALAVDGGMLGS